MISHPSRWLIAPVAVFVLALLPFFAAAQQIPIHQWSFNETSGTEIADEIGGAHGEVIGNGWTLGGGELTLPGGPSQSAPYADLPNGLISSLTDVTFEGWATLDGSQSWARLFDFGSSTGGELFAPGGGGNGLDYIILSASRGSNNNQQRAETRNEDGAGIITNGPSGRQWTSDSNEATSLGEPFHFALVFDADGAGPNTASMDTYRNGVKVADGTSEIQLGHINDVNNWLGRSNWVNDANFQGSYDEFRIYDVALEEGEVEASFNDGPDIEFGKSFSLNGGGQTYSQDFDEMETGRRIPRGWSGVTSDGTKRSADGLGLTDGFLTVPGDDADGVLGILNLGGNAERFGPAPDGLVPTWSAELGGANNLFGRDDAIADNASDRALGVSRENNDNAGELNFEIEIADGNLRAFVLDWDLEIWGGDPDANFRSSEGPGMKVDMVVGGNSYGTMTQNLLPGGLFDSTEDGGDPLHNPTLIDGNVHSVRNSSSGIKEVSDADGAVGNLVQLNFNSNWNDATDDGPNGWFSAVDNVRFRALAPGDADANGVVDVTDLLQLLGGQKFNQGVDGVTWEQGDFNADDQFNTGDLLAMLSFLSGTFPSDPYASEAGASSDAVADVIVNSETGEVTVDLAGHTVSAVIIESASEIFNGTQPEWDTTSQFPSTLPSELGNVLFTSTASGVDNLGAVISAEFLGRDKEFYLEDLNLKILIASEGGALTKGNVIVVPEPSTWLLLVFGSLAIAGIVRGRVTSRCVPNARVSSSPLAR